MERNLEVLLGHAVADFPKGPLGSWVMEVKFDGARLLYVRSEDGIEAVTRSGHRHDGKFPVIEQALRELPVGTVLDGELVHTTKGWNGVQSAIGSNSIFLDEHYAYFAFDVPYYGAHDLRLQPLHKRRLVLDSLDSELWGRKSRVRTITQNPADESIARQYVACGFEGVMLKHREGMYLSGDRSAVWLKWKPQQTEDATLIGFYDPKPGSKYEGNSVGGIRFRLDSGYEGRAAGMGDKMRRDMYLHPQLYIGRRVEVAHHGVQPSGALRHPQFKRFRDVI